MTDRTPTVRWDPDLERFLIHVPFEVGADVVAIEYTVAGVKDRLGSLGLSARDVEVLGDPHPEARRSS